MLTVIQRVKEAFVSVDEQVIGKIDQDMLVLCGFEKEDTSETLMRMLHRCLNYRIFSDEQGRMNRSLIEIQGGLLLVPQFTLLADTSRGLRPSFTKGATPENGQLFFNELIALAKIKYPNTSHGIFGADMQVQLCNDGPATFIMSF